MKSFLHLPPAESPTFLLKIVFSLSQGLTLESKLVSRLWLGLLLLPKTAAGHHHAQLF